QKLLHICHYLKRKCRFIPPMKNFCSIFLWFSSLTGVGQNLVPNPSFEEYLECPFSTVELQNQVIGWYSWNESPDFFYECSNDLAGLAGVPGNVFGYQYPIYI